MRDHYRIAYIDDSMQFFKDLAYSIAEFMLGVQESIFYLFNKLIY